MTDHSTNRPIDPPTIQPADLQVRLGDPRLTIVDVRPLSAYNGWRVGDDARGGHIPGAVSFPAAWLTSVDRPEIERLLAGKAIQPERSIVVHDTGGGTDDARRVAATLVELGITDVTVLAGGFSAWASDPDRPVDKLPRHDRLVHIEWLGQLLAGGRPESAPTGRFLLFHVNFGVPEE